MGGRLKREDVANNAARHESAWHIVRRLDWGLRHLIRRSSRRFGLFGGLMALAVLLGIGSFGFMQEQSRQLSSVRQRQIEQSSRSARPANLPKVDGRSSLKVFDDALLAHEEIPSVVQLVLNLAEDGNLSIQRGDYQVQTDPGGFLRYRMFFPVKGNAQDIYRFIQLALHAQRNLALESIQFKRDRIDAAEVEARIQWAILARLPKHETGTGNVLQGVSGSIATGVVRP